MALLEQQAEVIAVLPGQVTVRPLTVSRCERCANGQGCGGQWRLRASENAPLSLTVSPAGPALAVGDQVVIGLPAAEFQPAVLLLYGIPLLVLMLAAIVFHTLSLPDALASLLAIALFALALWRGHRRLRRRALPAVRLLRVLPAPCEQSPLPD